MSEATDPAPGSDPSHRAPRSDPAGASPVEAPPSGSLAAFVALIEAELALTVEPATADARLADDLGFDSLVMAEILVLLSQHGVDLPDDLVAELRTLGDLHHYFTVLATGEVIDLGPEAGAGRGATPRRAVVPARAAHRTVVGS